MTPKIWFPQKRGNPARRAGAVLLCRPNRIRSFFLPPGCSAECGVSYSSINQIRGNGLGTTSWRRLDYFSSQSQHLWAPRLGVSRQSRLSGQQKSPGHRHPGESYTLFAEHSTFQSRISSRTTRTTAELMHRPARLYLLLFGERLNQFLSLSFSYTLSLSVTLSFSYWT